jgi:uncharacterized protein
MIGSKKASKKKPSKKRYISVSDNYPHPMPAAAPVLPRQHHHRFDYAGAEGQCDCSLYSPGAEGQCDCSLHSEQPATLAAWLHITDRCNLRCAYCYLPHAPADMSVATGCAAIDATFRSAVAHDYEHVKLKYAGGEALLRFPFIVNLHRYACQVARQHHLSLSGVILSNGTLLTPAMVEQIRELGMHLMISLDGLSAGHDRQRCYASGQGSARDVTRAIELALAHGLTPAISITVSGRNASELPEVLAWVLQHDLPFKINFYRENQQADQPHDLALEETHIIESMRAAFKVIEANLPRRSLLASLVDQAHLGVAHTYPCGVGSNYLVFDHHGQVARCQMAMQQHVSSVHAADPLAAVRAEGSGLQNPPVDAKEGCRSCEWQAWCAGGCPLLAHQASGRYAAPSPYCSIYQKLFPEVLRLEQLRMLQYAQTDVSA